MWARLLSPLCDNTLTRPSPFHAPSLCVNTLHTKNTKMTQGGGGGGIPNPFDMGKLMESVKKAQQMVQVETQRVQAELEA